ncbi:unnamed protein product [Pedinophyceae sp. YPF-701]|nr:unnamed protein product [Pedinophyceae sp. YPF-701]
MTAGCGETDDALESCLYSDPSKLTAPIKTLKDKYEMLPAFLRTKGLMKQHIDSFNYFITREMKQIIRAKGNEKVTIDSDPNFFLKYLDIHVGKPCIEGDNFWTEDITPQQCRLRDITYAAPITVDVEYTRGRELITRRGVAIGRLPLMLRCVRCVLHNRTDEQLADLGECPLDTGGYFVVRGTEKAILIQEQLSKNRIIVNMDPGGLPVASVTSSTHERKSKTNLVMKGGRISLKHNAFAKDVPLVAVLRAMGMQTDQEIMQAVASEPEICQLLVPSIDECHEKGVYTEDQALAYLGEHVKMARVGARARRTRVEEVRDVLAGVVLAHVPVVAFDFRPKALYMCNMARRMLLALVDPSQVDDMDYYGNKRLELAGQLISLLFEDLFKKMNHDLRREVEAESSKRGRAATVDAIKYIHQATIAQGLESAISSGNWTIKRFRMQRKGMTQVLSRLSFIAAMGMMTRINSQFEKTRKVSGPRSLQPSQWGVICPADTPEGESCGLVKNLALMAHITADHEEGPLARLMFILGVQPVAGMCAAEPHGRGLANVMLNGAIVGTHREPVRLVRQLRALRRCGRLGMYVSVYVSGPRVNVACDGGRVCRPLIIVEEGRPRVTQAHIDALKRSELTFADFLRMGLVEWIDVNEENNCLVALHDTDVTLAHTHLEIEPFTIMGVCAGLIPYPHHNQSPRNTYQCAMGKQAMGNIALNQLNRMDTLLYLLCYPMKPLLTTKTIELCGFDRLGAGQNAIVAVMSYSGYDIEDSIIMNRASLDRGFGRCIVLKKHGISMKARRSSLVQQPSDRIDPPEIRPGHTRPTGALKCLDVDGLPQVGGKIYPGDIYINRSIPVNAKEVAAGPPGAPVQYKRAPLAWKGPAGEHGVVDRVLLTTNEMGDMVFKVLLRHTRRPELGDKFSSRHGQKGVVGNIVPQGDMPFSERGICPDLIMNPHGFPSRMTVGKMLELMGSKAAVHEGRAFYGTAFGEPSGLANKIEDISAALVEHGFSYSGKDMLTSGVTGEPLEAYIFMGPVYYQKLKHMVLDKMHARARGPRVPLTRQPTEGRARDGGLRLGEMERDCLVGYGASMLLLERLMISSDEFEVHVCPRCKSLGYYDHKLKAPTCGSCQRADGITSMKLPYACKLLFQELQSMNIMPRLTVE